MRTTTRHAPNGMVASVDHLASQAGIALLQAGGSAADAAIAASAVLAVTSPHLCGMGGDLFALVHEPPAGAPAALCAAGRAGSGADPDRLRAEGHAAMPFTGDIRSAPVPGCVDGWLTLHARFGRAPIADVLAPAIALARDGFPASPILAMATLLLRDVPGAEELYGDGNRAHGDRITRPGVAGALEAVARDGRDGFYLGPFGRGLVELGAGEYEEADLRRSQADWVEPLRTRVWDHDVWTTPPPSQGYLSLLGAAIAAELPLPADADDARWAHLLVEAARAAAHDRRAVLHDGADVTSLLSADEVARRRSPIDPDGRATYGSMPVGAGDTMFLCAIDRDRMGVSLIQSNASGFGCLLFEPTTGIGLHNRGYGFSLEPGHPAEYGAGRRPPHTLSPAMITRADGRLRATIGTMGGDAQPQIVLQLLARLLAGRQSAGATIGGPRWALFGPGASGFDTWRDPDGVHVAVESTAPEAWAEGLLARGHTVDVQRGMQAHFGHAHLIELRDDGMLAGAADPRALVSAAAGY